MASTILMWKELDDRGWDQYKIIWDGRTYTFGQLDEAAMFLQEHKLSAVVLDRMYVENGQSCTNK